MRGEFSNKVVVISGAARGIGKTFARAFLDRGAKVVALDRHWETDDPFYQELSSGELSLPLSCDITSNSQVHNCFAETIQRFDTVDVLINNAAMRQRDLYPKSGASSVLDTSDSDWERMYNVNVIGTLKLTRAFIAPMLDKKCGSIVSISANGSLTRDLGGGVAEGNHPHIRNQPYDASKAALTSMCFYLAHEIQDRNVACNVVFPGFTRTTGSEALAEHRRREGISFNTELRDPAHVVPVTLYLASQTGANVTGKAFDAVDWQLPDSSS